MATRQRIADIGAVPNGLGEDLTRFLTQVQRLLRAGVESGGLAGSGASSGVGSGSGSSGGSIGGGSTGTDDLTPPPTPSGVTVGAGLSFVFFETDAPTFLMGGGYLRTRVYVAQYPATATQPPVFADAVLGYEFGGQVGAMPSEPATRIRVWLTWVTRAGVESLTPAGGINGIEAETGQDVGLLLEALTGAITKDEISADVWRANTFAIAPPAGSTVPSVFPFMVQTVPVTINGVQIPAGVYMDGAYVNNLTAMVARLGNAWIDNAMIGSVAASKVTAGSLAVGQYIQSSNYVQGTQGWRINADGTAQFMAASVKGLLTAGQIDTEGLTIKYGGRVLLGGGSGLNWSDVTGQLKPLSFEARSKGGSASSAPWISGLVGPTGAYIGSGGRSYSLHVVRLSDGALIHEQYYDVYGAGEIGGRGAADLAADLNWHYANNPGMVVIVVTSDDEPRTNRLTAGLPAALYRHGASPGVFESSRWASRGAYVLVGVSGCGQGNGTEVYKGDVDGSTDSWASIGFSIAGGVLTVGGSGSQPVFNASNIGVYMDTALIGSAYIANILQSDNYNPNIAGWLLRKSDGYFECQNIKARGDIQATSVAGAGGTFGTITAGYLRNAANSAYLNLNASGGQTLLSAGNGAVRITADGDAYFRKTLASGTWFGSVLHYRNNNASYITSGVIEIDTGINLYLGAVDSRSLSARLGNVTGSITSSSPAAGAWMTTLDYSVDIRVRESIYKTGAAQSGGPYGPTARVILRVGIDTHSVVNTSWDYYLTSLAWTVDYIA